MTKFGQFSFVAINKGSAAWVGYTVRGDEHSERLNCCCCRKDNFCECYFLYFTGELLIEDIDLSYFSLCMLSCCPVKSKHYLMRFKIMFKAFVVNIGG